MEKSSLSLHLFIIISAVFIFSVSMFAAGTFISFMAQKKAIETNAQEKISEALKSQQFIVKSTQKASGSAK